MSFCVINIALKIYGLQDYSDEFSLYFHLITASYRFIGICSAYVLSLQNCCNPTEGCLKTQSDYRSAYVLRNHFHVRLAQINWQLSSAHQVKRLTLACGAVR